MSAIANKSQHENPLGQEFAASKKEGFNSRLQQTFGVFNRISDQLNQTYQELEDRIGELQSELVETDRERLRENAARQLLSERLHLIVNAMPVAVVLLDGRGVIAKSNAPAKALLVNELEGRKWIDVIQECFAPRPTDGHEVALKNGKLVSIATQSLKGEPGQIIVVNDQTETRRLQSKLNHHRKLSEMGRMTASLAHQIRTPLATATLYADHLSSPDLSEERRINYAEKLKLRLKQLEQQVRDMLIFSKGGVVLNSHLPVRDIIQELATQAEEHCAFRNTQVIFSQDIPDGEIRCNCELLTSVLNNLLENSMQACHGAGVVPHLTVDTFIDTQGFACIQIKDNGPGIPDALSQRVLEPFFTTKSTGTGLGLAVANAVVEAHGGVFSIGNNASQGACATIKLPMLEALKKVVGE